jgi:hypothetical protein
VFLESGIVEKKLAVNEMRREEMKNAFKFLIGKY